MTRSNVFRSIVALAFVLTLGSITVSGTFARSAAAGNGGVGSSIGNGGVIVEGDIDTGGKHGQTITVGDSVGPVTVQGPDISRSSDLQFAADGGLSVSDASGNNHNIAGS